MSKVNIESSESSKTALPASVSSNESDDAERSDRQNAFPETKASTLNKLMDVDVDMNRLNQ